MGKAALKKASAFDFKSFFGLRTKTQQTTHFSSICGQQKASL
jgi:hypothetical protein